MEVEIGGVKIKPGKPLSKAEVEQIQTAQAELKKSPEQKKFDEVYAKLEKLQKEQEQLNKAKKIGSMFGLGGTDFVQEDLFGKIAKDPGHAEFLTSQKAADKLHTVADFARELTSKNPGRIYTNEIDADKKVRRNCVPSSDEPVRKERFNGGATRSELKPSFSKIPYAALKRLAQRYSLGTDLHGRWDYQKSLSDPEYVRQLFEHTIDHLYKRMNHWERGDRSYEACNSDITDDDLAAALWGICVLIEVEDLSPIATYSAFHSPNL